MYAEECWHLANGGILTDTGVYYPPIAAPDGLLGVPWRLAAVVTAPSGAYGVGECRSVTMNSDGTFTVTSGGAISTITPYI